MVFTHRQDAGRQLATRLTAYSNREDVVVLGLPRGGVPVAAEIAGRLHLPLDIFLTRKLGVPGNEELAFGAVAAGDGRFLDQERIHLAGISADQIERMTRLNRDKMEEQALLYRAGRSPLVVAERTVILIDDGIATGASIYAAVCALRQMKPSKLVAAVPVAPISTCEWLRPLVDELIVLYIPKDFYAVGEFYGSFSQVSDEEVVGLLRQFHAGTWRAEESLAETTGGEPTETIETVWFRRKSS